MINSTNSLPLSSSPILQSSTGDLDFYKLIKILRKHTWWMIIIIIIAILIAFLYLRYTKPIYQSSSILKLNIKKQADFFGFSSKAREKEDVSNLSGEIELIKSTMLLNKVIDKLNLSVSYHMCGKIMDSEAYKIAPYTINYTILNENCYDKLFYVNIINAQIFELTYTINNHHFKETHHFGEHVKNNYLEYTLSLNSYFTSVDDISCSYFIIHSKPALISYLGNNMGADVINTYANTILISFKDHNNLKAKEIVAEIDSVYLQLTLQEKTKANKQKITFLENQLKDTEEKLEEYERYFENFVIENKTNDVPADIVKTVDELRLLQKSKKELLTEITTLTSIQKQLTQGSISLIILPFSENVKDEKIDLLLTEWNKLVEDKKRIASSYKETSFVVKQKINQLNDLKEDLLKQSDEAKGFLYDKLKELTDQIQILENRFTSLPFKNTQYSKNKRFYDLYETFYLSMMQRKAEYKIEEAGTVPEFVVLSPPTLPTAPVFPQKKIVYGISIILGLFFNAIFLVILYLSHHTIDNTKDLEKYTHVPLLGAIPKYEKEMTFSKLVVDKNPKSAISEAFRSIRTNLEFLITSDKKKKTISVTSTISGEGKTFVAVNLAGVIALSQQKVIILDLDMRKPKVHLAFENDDNSRGMSTILINKYRWSECIKKTSISTLDYISAGPIPPNPSELIMGTKLTDLITELYQTYDIVILDTPPIGLVTDGVIIMSQADIPLYIVRADYSKQSFMIGLNKLYTDQRFHKTSIILNALGSREIGYGYGYGYGSSYYEEEQKTSLLKKWIKRWIG